MSYEDYNKEEIKNIISSLQNVYFSKLKKIEITFLSELSESINQNIKIDYHDRDMLIAMYDRMRDD